MTEAQNYVSRIKAKINEKYENEPEFLETFNEFVDSVAPLFDQHPEYIDGNLLELMASPERIITFRVPWMDDEGNTRVNTGYRVQFNSALGPYKGGLRLHPSVNLSILKFLGFEQTFKNALTTLPIGGGKGGSDFDPKGKSDHEVMRFAQSFMTELQKYIGPDQDIPAGDIGTGAREIGYLYGQYKRLNGFKPGVLTGKPLVYGGSLARTEATGYGAVYFLQSMLEEKGEKLEGKRVILSGAGNVAIYAVQKLKQLGGIPITVSDSNGYVYDENGIDFDLLKEIKEVKRERLTAYAERSKTAKYYEGSVWDSDLEAEILLPAATQNEIKASQAEHFIQTGTKFIAEGANMPLEVEATKRFQESGVYVGPSKAVNAGGVAVSALEMSQNSQRLSWTFEEVDEKLKDIMTSIYLSSKEGAKEVGKDGNLVIGANIAGFKKVAEAMLSQGLV